MEDKDKIRKKKSSVWRYCEIIDESYALCNICQHKLSYKSSVTNLRKHFRKKHPEVAVPANEHFSPNGASLSDEEEELKNETQRATNTVIVDYLRPAGEENKVKQNGVKSPISYVRSVPRRDPPPVQYDYHRETKRRRLDSEETEYEVFGRSIVMQMKQLPLVSALELQAEIMNLMVQKRIQSLRQTHETNTEAPMQYALVYATEAPVIAEGTVETVQPSPPEPNKEETTDNS